MIQLYANKNDVKIDYLRFHIPLLTVNDKIDRGTDIIEQTIYVSFALCNKDLSKLLEKTETFAIILEDDTRFFKNCVVLEYNLICSLDKFYKYTNIKLFNFERTRSDFHSLAGAIKGYSFGSTKKGNVMETNNNRCNTKIIETCVLIGLLSVIFFFAETIVTEVYTQPINPLIIYAIKTVSVSLIGMMFEKYIRCILHWLKENIIEVLFVISSCLSVLYIYKNITLTTSNVILFSITLMTALIVSVKNKSICNLKETYKKYMGFEQNIVLGTILFILVLFFAVYCLSLYMPNNL